MMPSARLALQQLIARCPVKPATGHQTLSPKLSNPETAPVERTPPNLANRGASAKKVQAKKAPKRFAYRPRLRLTKEPQPQVVE
jgi:hypothetical protein